MTVCEGLKPGTYRCAVPESQFLILIADVAGPNFRFRRDERGVRTRVSWCLGWRSVFSILRHGGFHLVVVTEVAPVGGGADEKVEYISIKMT